LPIIKYIIADDHKIFRKGLRLALADDTKLKLVGEAGNGVELLQLLAKQLPDIILLDLKMPEMDGIEAMKQIRANYPAVKIIILTMYDDEQFILHLMEGGANGFLVKNAEPEEIKMALHATSENGYYLSNLVSSVMLKSLVQKNTATPKFNTAVDLTDKEREVIRMICEGQTAAEIAEQIFLSPRTVEGIKSTLFEKVGVRNIAGLIMYAAKNGLA
jgi:DNA-binding NarL/FixJ family response regulator